MVHAEIKGRIVLSGNFILNDKKEILLLFRKDHNHWETPGGKVNPEDCKDFNNPSVEDLAKTAERELHEEIGDVKVAKLKFFGKIEFIIPDGRLAIANKFITKVISGIPKVMEPDTFSKIEYLPISKLEQYPISPDLKLFLPKLKEYVQF